MTVAAITTAQHDGKSERDRLAEGEAILADKTNGATIVELMDRYGLSRATVHRRINQALKDRLAITVDQYRELENGALDDLFKRWQRQADAAQGMVRLGMEHEDINLIDRGMARHAEALNGILRVRERRARLNGLDAPVKADIHVTVTTPIDTEVAALVSSMDERSASRT